MTDTTHPSAFHWQPPRWLGVLLTGLQSLLGWIGAIAAMICWIVFVHHWLPKFSFVGIILTPLFVIPTVAIHEWGHVLGARAAGMTVAHVFVGPFQFLAQRRGWRVRWKSWKKATGKKGFHGFVIAYPNPDRPIRGASMLMIVAGPLANLLVAALATAVVLALGDSALGWLAAGMALLNLTVAVANLLPASRHFASDGLLLLQWLRCKDESVPELSYARINGLSIKGVLAEHLPPDQVAAIANLQMPMPLVHLWIVLKQHQNTGAWNEAAALADALEERVATIPDEWKPSLDSLVRSLRCEVRFSRSMAGLPVENAIDDELDADCDWYQPWLRPRCHALIAANAGDEAATRRYLEEARRWAERSFELALEKSEAILGKAVLTRLAYSSRAAE